MQPFQMNALDTEEIRGRGATEATGQRVVRICTGHIPHGLDISVNCM